jgi:maltokinase
MADLSFLEEATLQEWIVRQRWFGSKAREVAHIDVVEAVTLRAEGPRLVLAIVEARFGEGTHETYQVPIGLRPAREGWTERVIAEADGWTVYDGLADPAGGRELLHRMRSGSEEPVDDGTLRFAWAESAGAGLGGTVDVRPVGVEQSNSSVVFGDTLILKAFRRLEPGINPELELLRFLSARGFEHIAPLAGWYEFEGRLLDATLGILQEYLAGARGGWELALDELATRPAAFLDRLRALGEVTGEMHTALGSEPGDPAFAPEEPSTESLSLLTADVDEQIERIFLHLPEIDAVAPIAGRGQDVRERLQALSHIGAGGRVIRAHGDLHLGQTMVTDRGWVILDFEGEPLRSLPERRRKRSPLRDVAGMLRSFAYARAAAQLLRGVAVAPDWEERARAAFLEGYFDRAEPSLLPPGEGPTRQLLSVFELEKAVYDLRYELNNRPDWIAIPVAGIAQLLEVTD